MVNCSLDEKNRLILGTVPERWGRMDILSRSVLLAVGKTLRSGGLLNSHSQVRSDLTVGLIGGTRRGSLETDFAYAQTMASGPEFASPALFGYTLPNISLAEAAIHYRLTGPVFSLFADDPFNEAVAVARQWLGDQSSLCKIIVAGQLDVLSENRRSRHEGLSTIFIRWLRLEAKTWSSHAGLSKNDATVVRTDFDICYA